MDLQDSSDHWDDPRGDVCVSNRWVHLTWSDHLRPIAFFLLPILLAVAYLALRAVY